MSKKLANKMFDKYIHITKPIAMIYHRKSFQSADIDDLVQEALMGVWDGCKKSSNKIKKMKNPEGFLAAIVRNKLKDYRRKTFGRKLDNMAKIGINFTVDLDDLILFNIDPSFGNFRARHLIEKRLPPDIADMLIRYFFDKDLQEEIAKDYSLSVSQVWRLFRTAKDILSGELKEWPDTYKKVFTRAS